ncbi:MAG: ATP-binding protein, partial [Promethearchaeota archaeon]
MVIDNDSPPANPVADFEDFFRNFEDVPNEFKYRVKITQSYAKSENYITILFEDILNYQPILANYLKKNPEQALKDAAEAFKTIYRIDAGGDFNPDQEFFVRISTQNNSNEISLREIRSTHIDNLIYVKGIIIRASVVRPQIQTATFECPICGTIMQIDQDTSKLEAPRECENPACKNKKDFKVLTDDSIFIDQQSITIQEPPEDLRSGSIPQTLHTILTQKLVDSVRPGEHVKIMGILKSVPKEDNRGRLSTVFQTFLMANNIEGVKQEEEDQNLTQDDVNEILALAKEPGIQNKIARSIARGILGHDKLKMAAALSLFGGNQKLKKDGSKLRGDIHVLFMGDPGTGKSQILQNAAQIAPRSIYTSGKGASAAGLTAAVIKESNSTGLQLEAGALVLASGGIACIDEFDKMRNQDRSAIHEAMEQQTVSIAKAGIVATLQAKTAIIAAANPKNGRWNEYESSSANINLSPPLLSRFDLIFVVRDIPDRNNDDRIAEYILQNHMEGYSDTFTEDADGKAKSDPKFDFVKMNLLKKYISYAKNNFHPRLSKEAMLAIQKFYVDTRNANTEDPNTISI